MFWREFGVAVFFFFFKEVNLTSGMPNIYQWISPLYKEIFLFSQADIRTTIVEWEWLWSQLVNIWNKELSRKQDSGASWSLWETLSVSDVFKSSNEMKTKCHLYVREERSRKYIQYGRFGNLLRINCDLLCIRGRLFVLGWHYVVFDW